MADYSTPKDTDNSETYFACRESDRAAAAVIGKASTFYSQIKANSYVLKLQNMWKAYHGNFNQGASEQHTVTFTGEQGELVSIPVNMFRNLARHTINIITANRPVLEAKSINTDYKSLSQTYLANGILDYYMREKNLETNIYNAVEMAVVMGSAYIEMEWNATAGESFDFDPENGEYNYEGELEFNLLDPLSVVVDGTKENFHSQEWVLVRTFENKYNLAAKYPEYHDKIMGIPTKNEIYGYRLTTFSNDETDDIPIFKFYHKKSEALPEGRYMLFVSPEIVLLDMGLPYRTLPVFRLSPADVIGSPYGYTEMFDVYPLQEAINQTYSTILTNQTAFGVQNLFVPRGADISTQALPGGLNIIEGNAKPEPLQLTATPQEVYKFAQMLEQLAETQTGINSVTRGNPEASLRSGNSLALVQSMSLQFQSTFQRNYVKFLEDIGSSLIEILKDFANTPKMIAIVGRNKRSFLKEFTGDMISDIRRVIVDVGNPLARTIAGRVEIANNLANMKLIHTPEQYFAVMETGRTDILYESDMQDIFLIKRENEWLMDGKDVMADPLDRHSLHILEHRSVISDPDLRSNPELTAKVRKHIQEHIDMLRDVNPDILQLIKEQPLHPMPTAGAPGLPPGPMGGMPPAGGPPMGPPGTPPMGPPPGPTEPQMPLVNQLPPHIIPPQAPQMPNNGQMPPLAPPQPQPGMPGGPLGNMKVIKHATDSNILNPNMLGSQQSPIHALPNIPKVKASLLAAPNLVPNAK
jgi:hypothetical protein